MEIFEKFVLGIILILIVPILMAFPIMWLWNGVIVDHLAIEVNKLDFLHAWGLNLLCSFLFKNTNS